MRPLAGCIKELSILFLFQVVVVFYTIACYVCVFDIRGIVLLNFTDGHHRAPVVEFSNLCGFGIAEL